MEKIKFAFKNLINNLYGRANWQRINYSILKGSIGLASININPAIPRTWEFSSFSQNGEDGISNFLTNNIISPNKYFIEIGTSDGIENNTAFFAFVKKYSGLMIEGDYKASYNSKRILHNTNLGVTCINKFITKYNSHEIIEVSRYSNPDIFSIDIDGIDFYVLKSLFEKGLNPAIVIVEYNSTFGPTNSITVEYNDNFDISKEHDTRLYYGVSINAWITYFNSIGYKFITVDSNGINAFFVDPKRFSNDFLDKIKPVYFNENIFEINKFKMTHDERFDLIKHLKYTSV